LRESSGKSRDNMKMISNTAIAALRNNRRKPRAGESRCQR
jgi:hypothetical protein